MGTPLGLMPFGPLTSVGLARWVGNFNADPSKALWPMEVRPQAEMPPPHGRVGAMATGAFVC
jgi:hypothetical protein